MIKLTLTGIDTSTELSKLPKNCEIGILYTFDPKDRNRYPSIYAIHAMVDYLSSEGYKLALHVCGSSARHNLSHIPFIVDHVQRMQINGTLKTKTVEKICLDYPNHTIITQHTADNIHLLSLEAQNHALLIDSSGGNGISPSEWIAPDTDKLIGFAGGLSIENIYDEYLKIKKVAKEGFWLDMETRLRNENDLFDIQKAITIADLIKKL
jgi:phosphoribosylanthranilate isomerase